VKLPQATEVKLPQATEVKLPQATEVKLPQATEATLAHLKSRGLHIDLVWCFGRWVPHDGCHSLGTASNGENGGYGELRI
jgi:hypothetical protein